MCKAIREGDEMACICGLRWGVDEPDPHTGNQLANTVGLKPREGIVFNGLKECYQCEKKVPYLFADSRCKDCTRLTPGEMV